MGFFKLVSLLLFTFACMVEARNLRNQSSCRSSNDVEVSRNCLGDFNIVNVIVAECQPDNGQFVKVHSFFDECPVDTICEDGRCVDNGLYCEDNQGNRRRDGETFTSDRYCLGTDQIFNTYVCREGELLEQLVGGLVETCGDFEICVDGLCEDIGSTGCKYQGRQYAHGEKFTGDRYCDGDQRVANGFICLNGAVEEDRDSLLHICGYGEICSWGGTCVDEPGFFNR